MTNEKPTDLNILLTVLAGMFFVPRYVGIKLEGEDDLNQGGNKKYDNHQRRSTRI